MFGGMGQDERWGHDALIDRFPGITSNKLMNTRMSDDNDREHVLRSREEPTTRHMHDETTNTTPTSSQAIDTNIQSLQIEC